MTVLIIGAGLAGLTTAYSLVQQKQSVILVDAQDNIAQKTSYANGGQLSYSYIDPLASWAMAKNLIPILLGRDENFEVDKKTLNLNSVIWFFKFLNQCSNKKRLNNLQKIANLAMRSQQLWQQLPQQVITDSHYKKSGKLVFYRSTSSFKAAKNMAEKKLALGINSTILTSNQCIALEPQLQQIESDIKGGIFTKEDAVADSYSFCQALNQWLLQTSYYQLQLNNEIESFNIKNNKIVSISTTQGKNIKVEKVVLACGYASNKLLKLLNIKLPIVPLKGYSVTLKSLKTINCSVTDYENKIVFSSFNNTMRIAGSTKFTYNETEFEQQKINKLLTLGSNTFADAADYNNHKSQWSGIRACTPNSLPILGQYKYSNLWLNTAHNFLGFTLALGCAQVIAKSIVNSNSSRSRSSSI